MHVSRITPDQQHFWRKSDMVVLIAELDCGHFERQLIGCTESSLAREARRQSISVPIGFALWPSQQDSP